MHPLRESNTPQSKCESSSVGRARPCQGRGRGFESRLSLKFVVLCPDGGMVDTKDLKSFGFTAVRVQVPLRVRRKRHSLRMSLFFVYMTSPPQKKKKKPGKKKRSQTLGSTSFFLKYYTLIWLLQ